MDRKTQAEAAFLEWINSFPFTTKVASLNDLNDGLRIWEALRDIDPTYFTGDLPEGPSDTGKWPQRWQNLKHILRSLVSYIRDECGQPLPEDLTMGDLKLIAFNENAVERSIKLLKLALIAAINSPRATEYIAKMPTLSTSTQALLKESIEELQDTTNPASESDVPSTPATTSPPPPAVDPELFFEERFGKVMADNERLARENLDVRNNVVNLQNRLAHLQENHAILQGRLTQAEDRLQLNASVEGTVVVSSLKPLQIKIQEQEDFIAAQESTISEYQTNTEAMQKTIERNNVSSIKLQKLQDEIDELKVERDGLAKKANTVDKYKQKLQGSQDLEKENELLHAEIEDIRQNAMNTADNKEQLDRLRQTIDEYKRILPRIEQDCRELQVMKNQLEINNTALTERCETAEEQHLSDQETIDELRAEIRNAGSGALPSSGSDGGLDAELAKTTEKESKLQVAGLALIFSRYLNKGRKTRIFELESEITQLKTASVESGLSAEETAETSTKFLRKTLETLELIASAARTRPERPTPGSTGHLEQLMATCADEIIRGADALAKRTEIHKSLFLEPSNKNEELEKQEVVIHDLQERLKLAEAKAAKDTTDQLASQQEVENLKRENKLMASAFHDMAGRLQMNTVNLQRRNDPPRSWMNKVRRQLEQPAMVRSR